MIRTFAISALATLALAGCMTVQNGNETGPAGDGDTYLALGTEPGWTLEITPTRLNYVGSYGETRVAEANPGARTTFNGHRYEGKRLTVDITHGACSDGMSDQRYADHVTVELDGATLSGCGGATLPPADLAGTRWQMRSINGASVDRSIATSLAFDGTRMSRQRGLQPVLGDLFVRRHAAVGGADRCDQDGVHRTRPGAGTGSLCDPRRAGNDPLRRRRRDDPDGHRRPQYRPRPRYLIEPTQGAAISRRR